jgi:hypothetical protein
MYGRSNDKINDLIEKLRMEDVALQKRRNHRGVSGSRYQTRRKSNYSPARGISQQIIKAILRFDSKYSTLVDTPVDTSALGEDIDGKDASGSISYARVIGMILYLCCMPLYTVPYNGTFGPPDYL